MVSLISSDVPIPRPRPTFSGLPTEIRLQIYDKVFEKFSGPGRVFKYGTLPRLIRVRQNERSRRSRLYFRYFQMDTTTRGEMMEHILGNCTVQVFSDELVLFLQLLGLHGRRLVRSLEVQEPGSYPLDPFLEQHSVWKRYAAFIQSPHLQHDSRGCASGIRTTRVGVSWMYESSSRHVGRSR